MKTGASRVGIVTVCYNSMAVLPGMLASVPEHVPVILVDNAADAHRDDLVDLANRHGATLIANETNNGFGVACNQGARELGTEFLLFLNPDTVLAPDALDRLVEAADAHMDASAFNPRISSPQGRPIFKRRSCLVSRADWMPRGWPDRDCEVAVLSGAALFVRRAAFEAVGGFDPQIFLYHEDDDLSLRLSKQVGKLIFVRDALVTHMEGSSSSRSADIAGLKAFHMGRSRVYSTRKHGRLVPFATALISAVWQLVSPVVLVSRRKRAKQLAYLRGVLSTIGVGRARSTEFG